MRQPEILAKVHAPEVAAKRGLKKSQWLRSDNPKAIAEMARITALNPMSMPGVREKVSRRLKAMSHEPSVRGGNGRGMTKEQSLLMGALCGRWKAEYALSLGQRTAGYPTHYKIDLANVERRLAIEVDGHSHHARKDLDLKKDRKLSDLGWTVLRFWNWDIVTWINTGMPMESYISMTLAAHGIQVSRSTAP
jgi:very-short-patch-repair endonuclease